MYTHRVLSVCDGWAVEEIKHSSSQRWQVSPAASATPPVCLWTAWGRTTKAPQVSIVLHTINNMEEEEEEVEECCRAPRAPLEEFN